MSKDSWENALKFSIYGMPILLDNWLIGGNLPVMDQENKVLMALNERVKLDKESLPIKEIEILDIKPTILKVDRFDSWVRIDGIVDIELTYKPLDPGLLEEELNIDSFLNSMDLAKEEIEPEAVQWERFFVNEDLAEEDEEFLDDLDQEELDEDDDDDISEAEFYRYDKDKSSCILVREKSYSVIIDIGNKSIEDKDLLALTRANFTNAEIINKREVNVDILLGVEVRGETREAVEFDTNWQGVSLNTEGSYSLAQSEIKVAEVVDYHVVPEIDELRNEDGKLSLEGIFNIQLAIYPEEEQRQRKITIINLRKPISFSDISIPFQGDIKEYKLHINDIYLNLDEKRNIQYEAMVDLWLYEQPAIEEIEQPAIEEIELPPREEDIIENETIDLLQDNQEPADHITEIIIDEDTTAAPPSTFMDILDEYEQFQTMEEPEEAAPLAIDFLEDVQEFTDILEEPDVLQDLEAISETKIDEMLPEDLNLKVLSTEEIEEDFDESAFVNELLNEELIEDRIPNLDFIQDEEDNENEAIRDLEAIEDIETIEDLETVEQLEAIEGIENIEETEQTIDIEDAEDIQDIRDLEEIEVVETTEPLEESLDLGDEIVQGDDIEEYGTGEPVEELEAEFMAEIKEVDEELSEIREEVSEDSALEIDNSTSTEELTADETKDISEGEPIAAADIPASPMKSSGPKINIFKGHYEKPRNKVIVKPIEEPEDAITFGDEIKFEEQPIEEVHNLSTFRTRRARRLGLAKVKEPEVLEENDVSIEPVSKELSADKKYRLSFYLVKEGETLESIARKFSTDSDDIIKDNKISAVTPGESILIRKHRD